MTSARPNLRFAVAGLGNWLLRDDGVGVHALWDLERRPPPDAVLIDGGTAVLHTLDLIEGVDRVVAIDALRGGGQPGSLYLMDGLAPGPASHPQSIHARGLREALSFVPDHRRPRELLVVGVEPSVVTYGTELSPAVAAALPRVTAAVVSVLEGWSRNLATPAIIESLQTAEQPQGALP